MSLEQQIQIAVADAVKATLLDTLKNLQAKQEENVRLLTTSQAAEHLACSSEYIRALQDRGDLSLIFLPGSKHRRVLLSELVTLIEKSVVKRCVHTRNKKETAKSF
ncbi:hypothetical protein [Haliscomenobacter sp.]|uniref:hypothetical protein n=1 Tax=Haliscomenobacter sp. TaxID=2717303 RepID=UPI003BABDF00